MSLPFLPSLSEIEFLGLSLDEPFEGLEDDDDELLLLLEELVDVLDGMFWMGSYWNWRVCENLFYPGFCYFPSFWIQDEILPPASSRCCQHLEL